MEPILTDERLRNWLNSNQSARERLCLALLTLDPRFDNPRPRRPEGGPDGARDIELLFKGFEAWGAVGFRHSANDSNEDKAWVKKKFKGDVLGALAQKPELQSFIFFTNVDLTPGELNELGLFAEAQGISQWDILYRERLRILLDSAAGLGPRYQYLRIPLSEAEQVAFFERFGCQLEQMMLKQFDHVDKRLARIEFFHDCAKPLMGISLIVKLKRQYTPDELGHFRVLIEIINLHEGEPHPTLWVGCRDAYRMACDNGMATKLFGSKSLVWSRNPDEVIQSTVFSVMQPYTERFEAGGHIHKRGPYSTMAALDSRIVWVFVTQPLFEVMEFIGLDCQSYMLTGAYADALASEPRNPLAQWPEPLTEAETSVPWVSLRLKRDRPLAPCGQKVGR